MELDLNKPYTTADVAALIASKDDSEHRQLRVTTDGKAYLSDTFAVESWPGHAFVFETFVAGNDYVGPNAAKDTEWVERIERSLRDNWPYKGASTDFIDNF